MPQLGYTYFTIAGIHEKAGTKAPAGNQLQTNPETGTQTIADNSNAPTISY